MSLTFRAATGTDLPFMVWLIDIDSVDPQDTAHEATPVYEAALAAITADPNQALYIAELDSEPVGTFQLTFIPGIMRKGMWRALIESVHVAPDHRNKGLGGEMMRFAIDASRERGCGMVQLTSNKARLDAHRFYRRLGFQQSHEGFKLFL